MSTEPRGTTPRREPIQWKIALPLMLLGLVLGSLTALMQSSHAQSTTAIYISSARPEVGTTSSDLTSTIQARMYSYYNLATSGTVLQPVIDKLHLTTTVSELARSVQASVPANSSVIQVQVDAATSEQSMALANAIRDSLANTIQAVSPDQQGGSPAVQIFRYQAAADATTVTRPSVPFHAAVGLAIGFMAALAWSMALPRLRGSVLRRRRPSLRRGDGAN